MYLFHTIWILGKWGSKLGKKWTFSDFFYFTSFGTNSWSVLFYNFLIVSYQDLNKPMYMFFFFSNVICFFFDYFSLKMWIKLFSYCSSSNFHHSEIFYSPIWNLHHTLHVGLAVIIKWGKTNSIYLVVFPKQYI